MKKAIYIISLLAFALSVSAQDESKWNILKHNKEYICGEGVGTTEEEADKNALADLISQISVSVSTESKVSMSSKNANGALDETSQFSSSVETYSSQTIGRTEKYKMYKAPNFRIGRAIKVAEVNRMFKEREERAIDLVHSAEKGIKTGHIDDALKNYYWALTLLKSLQYPNAAKYTGSDGMEHVLTNWIKDQMAEIFDEVKIECVERDGDDVDIEITYKGKPVNSLGFTYFDGRQWSPIVSADDGLAKLEFVKDYSPSTYQLRLEYQYRNAARADKEVESVLSAVRGSEFPRSEKKIKGLKKQGKDEKRVETAVAANAPRPSFTVTNAKVIKAPTEISDKVEYQTTVTAIENAIRSKNAMSVKKYFTTEGWDIYNRLIGYGAAKVIGTPSYKFYENGEYVTARGLQMSFSFKNGTRKSFVEEVVFTFDESRKICNVSFGLGRTAEDDILHKGVWDEKVRLTIMNFLENYKTAYALKRLDYIQSIFDEDAIIIVGNVVKKVKTSGDLARNTMSSEQVKYNRYTKQQYMENLRKCFESQEFVNLHFSNNEVRKGNRDQGEVYGIQLEQDYYSATYGDHGYLFLLVDLNDPKQPIIKVRTWQPNRDMSDPKLNGGLYSIANF